MRRSYISPEFDHNEIYGTFNMAEESNFFGAKMLEIEDSIYISNNNVIYYENSNGEQIDLASESILESKVYSSSNNKLINHNLILDESQSDYQKNNNTRWILDINLRGILSDYIFAQMKRWRTFEGIKNNMTFNNDVSSALKNYISLNVIDRYKISKVELYIQYTDLRSNNLLRYKNTWDEQTFEPTYQFNKFQSETSYDASTVRILFSQERPSANNNFKYFFNLLFVKV